MKLPKDQQRAQELAIIQQEEKVVDHLNQIKTKLTETKSITQEYANRIEKHMNAYWKFASKSKMHPHVKSSIGIIIQSIKTIIKRKTDAK